jgi:hypothetical protein
MIRGLLVFDKNADSQEWKTLNLEGMNVTSKTNGGFFSVLCNWSQS